MSVGFPTSRNERVKNYFWFWISFFTFLCPCPEYSKLACQTLGGLYIVMYIVQYTVQCTLYSTFHNFSKFADIALHMSGTHLKHHPLNTHTPAKTFSAFPENFISDSSYVLKNKKFLQECFWQWLPMYGRNIDFQMCIAIKIHSRVFIYVLKCIS